jgi:acyl carrier protein
LISARQFWKLPGNRVSEVGLDSPAGYWAQVDGSKDCFSREAAVNKDDVRRSVKTFIVEELLPGEDPDNLTDQTRFVSDGILDSLASLKLVSHLEEHFGVKIEAHEVDVDHLDTLDSIAELVISKRGS